MNNLASVRSSFITSESEVNALDVTEKKITYNVSTRSQYIAANEKLQGGIDREKAQSEKISHSKVSILSDHIKIQINCDGLNVIICKKYASSKCMRKTLGYILTCIKEHMHISISIHILHTCRRSGAKTS